MKSKKRILLFLLSSSRFGEIIFTIYSVRYSNWQTRKIEIMRK